MSERLTFHAWLRTGIATAVDAMADGAGLPPSGEARVEPRLRLGHLTRDFSQSMALRGPGDVLRLDASAISAVQPPAGERDCAPNYFAHVEFADPALPWMFTPASAQTDADGRLIPWMVLVVIRDDDEEIALSPMEASPGLKLSFLTGAGEKLPQLDEAHAWAHVQDASGLGDARTALETRPDTLISRILCPARLDENAAYVAALVPSFEAGRLAGLGREPGAAGAALAWTDATDALDLPVYHHWRFTTGDADFEELVRRLFPYAAGTSVGLKDLEIGHPNGGMNLDELPGLQAEVSDAVFTSYAGALMAPIAKPRNWPKKHRKPFEAKLADLLDPPAAKAVKGRRGYEALTDDPLITPPVYGSFAQDRSKLARGKVKWGGEANLDPSHRATAGMGARVVRKDQEALMGRAWARAKGAEEVEPFLRSSRTAMVVGEAIHGRLLNLPEPDFLQVMTPLHDKVSAVAGNGGRTVGDALMQGTVVPDGVLSAPFRRVASVATTMQQPVMSRNEVVKPALMSAGTQLCFTGEAVAAFDAMPALTVGTWEASDLVVDNVTLNPEVSLPVLMDSIGLSPTTLSRDVLLGTVTRPGLRISGAEERVLSRATGSVRRVARARSVQARSTVAPDTGAAVARLASTTEPRVVLPPLTRARVEGLPQPVARQAEIPRSFALVVSFPEPAYARLQAMNEEAFLPGYGTLPDDSVTLLKTNPAFIDAYMLGLNHEMAREFAWRQFPTRLSDTWFRRFWDYIGAPERTDIKPLAKWVRGASLGRAGGSGGDTDTVILVKGGLFRRFPRTLVYAVPARWEASDEFKKGAQSAMGPGQDPGRFERVRVGDFSQPKRFLHPIFRGQVGRSASFFGFEDDPQKLVGTPTPQELEGDPGWFIVFEQAAGDRRFGLDAADRFRPNRAPRHADNLNWGHFAADQAALEALRHAPLTPAWADRAIGRARWGRNAAETARLCLQSPVRIMFHASALLTLPDGGAD